MNPSIDENEIEVELCPLGYKIGANAMSIPWDMAIAKGEWADIKNTTIAINIHTLIRNASESWSADNHGPQLKLAQRVEEDIDLLIAYFSDVHDSAVHIYAINYDSTNISKLPNYRVAKTDKQKENAELASKALMALRPRIDKWHSGRVVFEGTHMITHFMYDLALASYGTRLIESYTGKIKRRSELNSKLNLTPEEKLVVPFTKLTYMLYGDKQHLNKNTKLTRNLLKVLLTAHITPLSTESRLSMSIKSNDQILYRFIKDIL